MKNILKAAKNSYQEVTKENKQLKQYITTIKQQQQQQYKQQQQKQQAYFSKPKNIKTLSMKKPLTLIQKKTNKKHLYLKKK